MLGLETSKGLEGGASHTGNGISKWSGQPRSTKEHQAKNTFSVKEVGGKSEDFGSHTELSSLEARGGRNRLGNIPENRKGIRVIRAAVKRQRRFIGTSLTRKPCSWEPPS